MSLDLHQLFKCFQKKIIYFNSHSNLLFLFLHQKFNLNQKYMDKIHLSQLSFGSIFRLTDDMKSLPFYRGRFVPVRNGIKCKSVYDHVVRYLKSESLVYAY